VPSHADPDEYRAATQGPVPPGPGKDWPAVRYESLPWTSNLPPGAASRAQTRRHAGPYQAAVVPHVAGASVELTGDVLALADEASQEIARFDLEMGDEMAPFSAVLLRSESAASSQIEDLTASACAIAEAEVGDTSRHNAALIVANTNAMRAAIHLSARIDEEAILAMHRALMGTSEPGTAGRWRQQQVWIGGGSLGPHHAVFVPPHHSRVQADIKDLLAFVARDDVPVLAQAAVAHAQFETIHPFLDGNGRTGRALIHSMLRNKGLTRRVTVPVSAGLLVDTEAYFGALGAYRTGYPAEMVARLAEASFAAIANGRELIQELRAVRQSWTARVTARRDSAAWRVADLLLRHPVIDSRLVTTELGIAPANVYRYIKPLEDVGVLTEFTLRRRNRTWRATEVLAVLDAFAARAGRRTTAAN